MKGKQRRLEFMIKQLSTMHEQLFGHKYAIGIQINQQSQFNKIIESFRQLIFTIRHTQQQRLKRQNKKNYHQSPEGIRINYEIREDIQRAEGILAEAIKRVKNDTKKKRKNKQSKQNKQNKKNKQTLSQQVIQRRQKIIENCYQLLKDIKQTQQGGVYQPPTYQTLADIKKQLIGKDYESVRQDSINIEQQQFFDQANKRDQQMDNHLDEIIQGNDRIKNKMINANLQQDQIQDKVMKNLKKTQQMNERVVKDQKDLLEILNTYRRPNQLCLDITLVLMVLALIGVVINLIRTL